MKHERDGIANSIREASHLVTVKLLMPTPSFCLHYCKLYEGSSLSSIGPLSMTGRRAVKSFFLFLLHLQFYIFACSHCVLRMLRFLFIYLAALHYALLLLLTCFPSTEGPFHAISHAVTGAVESQDP